MSAKNQHLVPDYDLPYFRAATVQGLRLQLRENGLDESGLKYDLYLRLRTNRIQLYTEDSSSEGDQPGDDQSGDDQSGDDQSGDDHSGDEHPVDDQGGNPPGDDQPGDDRGGDPLGGGGKKRRRDDGDDDGHDDNDQDPVPPPPPPPPPRKRLRVGSAFPVEVQLQIMANLNFAQLWNLAMAAPEGYLSDDINVFILDASRQHDIDYPPGIGGGGGGSGSGHSAGGGSPGRARPRSDVEHPLSLLQWAGRRCMYDSEFRAAWPARLSQLVDAYLQVYGNADPGPGHDTEMERIMWYFRSNPPDRHVLGHAARDQRPDVVHLLLARGADVNHAIIAGDPSSTALNWAVEEIGDEDYDDDDGLDNPSLAYYRVDLFHAIFALIGAGADIGAVTQVARDRARALLEGLVHVPDPGDEEGHSWEEIINFRGLNAREFVADERSDYFQRVIVTLYMVYSGNMGYPGFNFS